MAVAMCYIVTEWCLQSHLSTADLTDASRGLFLTRRFRWITSPFRDLMHHTIEAGYGMRRLISNLFRGQASSRSRTRHSRRSVRWTKLSSHQEPQTTSTDSDIPLSNLTPGRPRVGSDAPLMQSRDVSARPSSVDDTRQLRPDSLETPRTSTECHTLPETETESPSRLHVPEARPGYVRQASDRGFSV